MDSKRVLILLQVRLFIVPILYQLLFLAFLKEKYLKMIKPI